MDRNKQKLRTGLTTGTCSAAAAAGATEAYFGKIPKNVSIKLPMGIKVNVPILSVDHSSQNNGAGDSHCLIVKVRKDAGDDPDITHKAIIGAILEVETLLEGYVHKDEVGKELSASDRPNLLRGSTQVVIQGGSGVGRVTRPGLPVAVGKPAINPVPLKMIETEVIKRLPKDEHYKVRITIFVENGEKLAKKTLNPRLGIKGGISILGTTGIVKPFSAQSYKDTIDICLRSAQHLGYKTCILSTGRKSERISQPEFPNLPDACFVQIADFFAFSLKRAVELGFEHIVLTCFFGKLCKWAMELPYTHAREKLLDFDFLAKLSKEASLSKTFCEFVKGANTAREIFESQAPEKMKLIRIVGNKALSSAKKITGSHVFIEILCWDFKGKDCLRWN